MIEPYLHFVPSIHADAWVHAMAYVGGDVTLARGVSVWPTAVLRGDQGSIVVGEDSARGRAFAPLLQQADIQLQLSPTLPARMPACGRAATPRSVTPTKPENRNPC